MKRGILIGVVGVAVVVAGLVDSSAGTSNATPPTSSSPLPGTAIVTVDGATQTEQGTLLCIQRPDSKLAIMIEREFAVVVTDESPPIVHSAVFPYGSSASSIGMEFDETVAGTGQASAVKDGSSYKITGSMADAAQAYRATKPFEIDVTCPSAPGAESPSTGGSSTASAGAKPARVPPPQGIDASPAAIAAAKAAPAFLVDPANPPKPTTQTDFRQRVLDVANAHSGNVEVVTLDNQTLVRSRHWDYVDYDEYHRPALYNPISESMTFHYFYSGAYQEVDVPAGGRIVLNVAITGVFPFTAVSDSYVASGTFNGGAWIPPDGWNGPPPPDYTPPPPPAVYDDVSADIPADNQTVQVGKVTMVGHDDNQPAGSQDTFMLDDSTLAWGQANDPSNGGQITVTKTQSLPGVGPTDSGSFLVALANPQQPTHTWWPWALGGVLVLVVAVGLIAWVVRRRKGARI